MRIHTGGTRLETIGALRSAILSGKATIITNIKFNGENQMKGFVLPSVNKIKGFKDKSKMALEQATGIYTRFFTLQNVNKEV